VDSCLRRNDKPITELFFKMHISGTDKENPLNWVVKFDSAIPMQLKRSGVRDNYVERITVNGLCPILRIGGAD
jgi:hypothetical protein